MTTLVGKFRKLFTQKKQRLPSFIEVDVDPKKHWNILEDIGEGSFGAVKKVSKKSNPTQLAAFKCTEVQEGEEVEDLAIEVEILLACKHENVVGIFAAYYFDNCLSVMLEYCAGGAVDQIILELDKALTENQIAYITRQTCTGLAYLHSKYVIHRDLKAGNLLLTSDGIIKIADFGVSCMLNSAEEGSNTFIGTPHWMSPEVIRCETMTNLLYNCKADIWSLGITCIQLAQKEPPYHEMSAERVRLKILRSTTPPSLDNPNGHSTVFHDFISRCLVINPDERCTATDLLTHPFVVNAIDKKPIMVLLLEMSADFSEEPVFDTSNSCGNSICSSDGTSIWSRTDETMNSSLDSEMSKSQSHAMSKPTPVVGRISQDNEKTPVVDQSSAPILISKKKRAAPAPPPITPPTHEYVVTLSVNGDNETDEEDINGKKENILTRKVDQYEFEDKEKEEEKEDESNGNNEAPEKIKKEEDIEEEVRPEMKEEQITQKIPEMKFVSVSVATIPEPEENMKEHLSPSSKAVDEILDDLNDVLDQNYQSTPEIMASRAPPPEPPPDYDETPKAPVQPKYTVANGDTPKIKSVRNHIDVIPTEKRNLQEKENAEPKKDVLIRRTPNRQTATKRTRTFTLDGIQVTSTTTQLLKNKQTYEWKKQQEREYLRMQRGEARQRNEHEKKSAALQEQQEKTFLNEKMALEKAYQSDIDMLSKVQKKKIEEIEKAQEEEIKQQAKRLKIDQERQIKAFREQLVKEQKMLKQESDQIPKTQRKEYYRVRKEQLDFHQAERELQFLERLDREHEMFLEQLRAGHRERITVTERAFLEQRQQIEQSLMTALWELEERQLTERHNLNTQQLKELYLLQRSQMMARHQKEKDFIRRQIEEEEERLLRDLSTNRKNLPKSLRTESKARIKMFKESLFIKYAHMPDKWDQLMRKFQDEEKERVKKVIEEYESKYAKKMEDLMEENRLLVKELNQIHNEKRMMLCENEQQMLSECEQQFQNLISESRASRPVKKLELEIKFKEEMEKQLKFYNVPANVTA